MRGSEVAGREDHKDERIEPKIRKAKSFGKGTDADRLEPGRWKHQADQPSLAGERGHGHEQARKVHRRNNGYNRGGEDRRYLGLGECRDDLSETAGW